MIYKLYAQLDPANLGWEFVSDEASFVDALERTRTAIPEADEFLICELPSDCRWRVERVCGGRIAYVFFDP